MTPEELRKTEDALRGIKAPRTRGNGMGLRRISAKSARDTRLAHYLSMFEEKRASSEPDHGKGVE